MFKNKDKEFDRLLYEITGIKEYKEQMKLYSGSQREKTLLIAIGILIFLCASWYIPKWQIVSYGIDSWDTEKRLRLEDDLRKTIINIAGGAVIAIGLYLTYRRIRASEDQVVTTQDGLITDRFTRAIDQLGSTGIDGKANIEVRLGGIYALEQIAKEQTDKYHNTIMEILAAYVRKNSPRKPCEEKVEALLKENSLIKESSLPFMREDIAAVVSVIRRRDYHLEEGELDFSSTYLPLANFSGAELPRFIFLGAELRGADFTVANLVQANFAGADLREADLSGANLNSTWFSAKPRGRIGLWAAENRGVDLRENTEYKANISGADLTNAKHVSSYRLCGTKSLYKTKLDDEIKDEIMKMCPNLLENPKDEICS